MKQKSSLKKSLPPNVDGALRELGDNLRIARKRRGWTIDNMASRMFVSRQTLSRLEHGDSGAGLAVLATALWVLGLDKDILGLADPAKDQAGIYLEYQNQPERVRKSRKFKKPDF